MSAFTQARYNESPLPGYIYFGMLSLVVGTFALAFLSALSRWPRLIVGEGVFLFYLWQDSTVFDSFGLPAWGILFVAWGFILLTVGEWLFKWRKVN